MIFSRAALIDHRNMAGRLGMVGDIPSLVRGLNKNAWKALAPDPVIHNHLLFCLKIYALIYVRMCPLLSSADLHPTNTYNAPPVPIMYQPQWVAPSCGREFMDCLLTPGSLPVLFCLIPREP